MFHIYIELHCIIESACLPQADIICSNQDGHQLPVILHVNMGVLKCSIMYNGYVRKKLLLHSLFDHDIHMYIIVINKDTQL